MHKIKIVSSLILFVLLSTSASALSVKEYREFRELEGIDRDRLRAYINGVGVGLSWSNTILKHKGQSKLFCEPSQMVINVDNYFAIIDQELKTGRYEGGKHIELVLYNGLEKTFPCQ